MKRIMIISLLVCLVLFAGINGTAFAGDQDVTIVNQTGIAIYSLYIAPADSDNMGENMLADSVLENGEKFDFNFSGDEKDWDIIVTDLNDNPLRWRFLYSAEIKTITLYFDGTDTWADIQ